MMYNENRPENHDESTRQSRGRFVTFEGIDGTGKSTQMALLAAALRRQGYEVLELREPGGTAIGEQIRHILLDSQNGGMQAETELLLFEAARAQLVREIIAPALSAGIWVICDRFYDSSSVYQGYGRGLDLDMIDSMNGFAVDGCRPDATILLDLTVAKAVDRLNGRTKKADRLDGESLAFMAKIRQGYLTLADRSPGRMTVIDADQPEETLAQQIYQIIREGLSL